MISRCATSDANCAATTQLLAAKCRDHFADDLVCGKIDVKLADQFGARWMWLEFADMSVFGTLFADDFVIVTYGRLFPC